MTDTRQSNIEESIATEKERDELRRRIDAALAVCEDPDTYPDEDAALDLVASILRGDRPASGAQPFDPAKHSSERGTVIGGG